jgi:hypothetical protein
MVAREEAGVDGDARDDPRCSEADDDPVVPAVTAAPGLPAVDDLTAVAVPARLERRRAGRQQVLLVAEGFVAGRHHGAAEPA